LTLFHITLRPGKSQSRLFLTISPAWYNSLVIKAVPADFIVEEKADLPLRKRGAYRVYLLQKSDWNTLDLLHFLSRSLALPLSRFSYGGKKDKHGLTAQFITIRSPEDYGREGRNFVLTSLGFMDRPMGPDLIKGNTFTVTIRKLDGVESISQNLQPVRESGFPNFFDDQRFRSYDPERGFFAEKILRRHWNGALKIYLTSARDDDGKKERERKNTLFRSWKDWPSCLGMAEDPLEKRILRYLVEHPENSVEALHFIPPEEISMQYAAFQSHLWNEVLRRIVRQRVKQVEEVEGKEGGFLFWAKIPEGPGRSLLGLEIPTAAAKMVWADDFTRPIYEQILMERGLRAGSFRTKSLHKSYFRSVLRRAVVLPDDLRIGGNGEDELHPGKKKLTLSFSLPRGVYGTMLIKRLTLKVSISRGY
jgi:tRNA pseudouridine13 synthase